MKVGTVQMNSLNDKSRNLDVARAGIEKLAGQGADLVVLPEIFNFNGPDDEKLENVETMDGPTQKMLQEKARELKINIHGGSMMVQNGDKISNRTVVYNRNGEEIARYDKIHMFDVETSDGTVYRESDIVAPGSETVTFECEGITIGLSICYDLRFPELFRKLSEKGASLIIIPAAFTLMTGKDHWETLIRARAIENICYVAACGNWGPCPPYYHSWGHSMVVDPWGAVITQASDQETTIIAELDLDYMMAIREKLPALKHRRLS